MTALAARARDLRERTRYHRSLASRVTLLTTLAVAVTVLTRSVLRAERLASRPGRSARRMAGYAREG